MSKLVRPMLLLAALAVMAPRANAVPIVNLSSPNNLLLLAVGDTVRIDVTLSGLEANDFIFVLNTRELFPSTFFQPVPDPANSSGLTPGPILVTPAQRASFNALSSLAAGSATGNFSDLNPAPSQAISTNGLFYSFMLRAIAAGSGVIQFDPANTTFAATSTGFNLAPLPTGGPLPFTIAPAVVPEPSTMVMAASGALMGLGLFRRRRSRTAA